ncbi:MAG: geranylgeranyl reductase family protein [Candidatus Iainarchaeum archaeon]|uniref:Geranylgeranyl reductase family protein n=1 Tax=Candidatus Iainarchaeum sp. TaxID=3101447 RepID=A0A7T9I190_9ARCH|nr:MAG: geranylgeranyl reductase family protein [Candidatus Diapherotrites archaeon]
MPVQKMDVFDVIVSGAGPAGATTALFLARAGKKVLLLDKEKFPRDKICADNKTWKCLDIVKELGLWKQFQKLPKAEIYGVLVASPNGSEMYTPLHEKDIAERGHWYNVKRIHFDNLLAQAAKKEKNITFKEKCAVVKPIYAVHSKTHISGVTYHDAKGKTHDAWARVVVGADGSQSPIAKAVGHSPVVKGRYATNTRAYFENVKGPMDRCELYYLKGICPGYFWIFPVDKKTCNVGIGMRPEDFERQKKSLEQILRETIALPQFKGRFKKAKQVTAFKEWGLSVLGKRRPCAGNGWVLVGDAGTFAMTFSGEGVGPSMRTGKIAAQGIVRALNENDVSARNLKKHYEDALWKILNPEVKGFRWLEFLLLNERLFDFVIAKSAKNKELIEISSRMQHDYTLSKKLVHPKTALKMLLS